MEPFARGRYGEALSQFERALAAAPSDATLRCNVAAARFHLELYRACIKDCDAAIAEAPAHARAYLLKGQAWAALGKKGKAKKAKTGQKAVPKYFW